MPGRYDYRLNRRAGGGGGGDDEVGLQSLVVPFLANLYPAFYDFSSAKNRFDASKTFQQTTDFFSYNDTRRVRDHKGNAQVLPKHCGYGLNGNYIVQSLFQQESQDWTDLSSNLTETNATGTYQGDGEVLVEGLDGGATDLVSWTVLSGTSIVGRVFGLPVWVKGSGTDIGKDVDLVIDRDSGGTSIEESVTVTLTAAYQKIYVGGDDGVTGVTSNTGITISVRGAASNAATDCTVRFPTPIEWLAGQDKTAPPDAEWLAYNTPMGAAIPVSTVGAGWTDNGDGTYTHASGTATLAGAASKVVNGRTYTTEITITGRTAGSVTVAASGDTGTARSTNSTFHENLTPTSTGTYTVTPTSDFDGTVTITVKEATFGVYASNNEPNTSVTSGVISGDQNGTELTPLKTRRVGNSITFRDKLKVDLWQASTAVAANKPMLPPDWEWNYNNEFYFKAQGAGTTSATAPDFSGVTAAGQTVVDNDITWEAVDYYTLRGALDAPAVTNSLLDNRDLSTGNWSGAATVAQDAVGIDGVANSAHTVTDSGASFEPRVNDVTILDNTNTHSAIFPIKKTVSASTFPGVELTYTLGTATLNPEYTLNTDTGVVTHRTVSTTADDISVVDIGDFWVVVLSKANNGTGNTNAGYIIWPAVNADGSGTWAAATQGSCVYDFGAVLLNTSHADAVAFVKSGAFIETTTAAVTATSMVDAIKASDANWNNTKMTALMDVSMLVDQGDISAVQNLFTVDSGDATAGLHLQSDGDLAASDGTNTVAITDWSETAGEIIRTAMTVTSGTQDIDVKSASKALTNATGTSDNAYGNDGNILLGGVTLNYPMLIHSAVFIPGEHITITDELDPDTA